MIYYSKGSPKGFPQEVGTCKTLKDIPNNSISINCSANQLSYLNLSERLDLIRLFCDSNNILKIDLTGCYRLCYVTCNPISNLDDYFYDPKYDIDFTIWN